MTGLQNGRDPSRGDFDWRRFASAIRAKRGGDLRGIRNLADDIGITASDLSRAMSGQVISTGRVFALCDWMGRDPRDFYLPPENEAISACFGRGNVKHAGSVQNVS